MEATDARPPGLGPGETVPEGMEPVPTIDGVQQMPIPVYGTGEDQKTQWERLMERGGSEADRNLYVEFYHNAVEDRDFIRMKIPGDQYFEPDVLVEEEHKMRFPEQWKAYRKGEDQIAGQTRIDDIPWIDNSLKNRLKTANVYTLEALSEVSDGNIQNIGLNGSALRDRAREVVMEKKKLDHVGELESKLHEQSQLLEKMQFVIDDLQSRQTRKQRSGTANAKDK